MKRPDSLFSVFGLALLIFVLAGCVRYPAGIAPSNIPLEGRTYHVLGLGKGKDRRICLLGVLPISGANYTRPALKRAIGSYKDGDALIDITVEYHTSYWILWSTQTTTVEGWVIAFPPGSPDSAPKRLD